MISIALLITIMNGGVQDEVVSSIREARRPVVFYADYVAQCGSHRLSLSGISGGGAQFDSPTLELDRQTLPLNDSIKEFLSSDRSAYRISAACPSTTPAVQLIIYRAQALPDQSVSYELRALDISSNGRITIRGSETVDAETFWFR